MVIDLLKAQIKTLQTDIATVNDAVVALTLERDDYRTIIFTPWFASTRAPLVLTSAPVSPAMHELR